jgi:hypothetical protein
MCVQAGNIVSSNIYVASDAPYYRQGNKVLIGMCAANMALYGFAKWYYVWKNARREKLWNSWTPEEQKNYLTTTKDKGNKRVDFRFAH